MALFIGRLGRDVRTSDLEDVFRRYGKMSRCEVKGNGMRELSPSLTHTLFLLYFFALASLVYVLISLSQFLSTPACQLSLGCVPHLWGYCAYLFVDAITTKHHKNAQGEVVSLSPCFHRFSAVVPFAPLRPSCGSAPPRHVRGGPNP